MRQRINLSIQIGIFRPYQLYIQLIILLLITTCSVYAQVIHELFSRKKNRHQNLNNSGILTTKAGDFDSALT